MCLFVKNLVFASLQKVTNKCFNFFFNNLISIAKKDVSLFRFFLHLVIRKRWVLEIFMKKNVQSPTSPFSNMSTPCLRSMTYICRRIQAVHRKCSSLTIFKLLSHWSEYRFGIQSGADNLCHKIRKVQYLV